MPPPVPFDPACAPGVRGLEPYIPGKPMAELEREYGIRDAIKLASNENPLGPSAAAIRAMEEVLANVGLYPDGGGFELRAALAGHLGCRPEQITLGNGSNDVLVLLAETFLTPESEAVYSQFAFVVYALAVQAASARARVAPALPEGHPMALGHDLEAMAALVGPATRLVYIANPNNPTGTWLDAGDLRRFLEQLPRQVIAVVDEAYGEYVTGPGIPATLAWLEDFPNLVVTRTFSKAYGLAGLRVGYGVSHPAVAELLNRVRQPFNVNSLAQAAAVAALGDQDHVARSREMNRAGLARLARGLGELGWRCLPSAGNFILADTGGPAGPWYEALLREGIIVRPVGNYGLPRHLRITVGTPEQVERLLGALGRLTSKHGR